MKLTLTVGISCALTFMLESRSARLVSSRKVCLTVAMLGLSKGVLIVFLGLSLSDKRRMLARRKVPLPSPEPLDLVRIRFDLRPLRGGLFSFRISRLYCCSSWWVILNVVFLHHKPLKRLPMLYGFHINFPRVFSTI